MIPEAEWERATSAIAASRRIAICCHVNPDADALGSMLGLSSFLERSGKKLWRSWGDVNVTVPAQYAFLPDADKVVPESQVPSDLDLFIAIDCGDERRLELLRDRFASASATMNIDHHISNDHFAEVNLVDSARASSCEIAFELIQRLDGNVTPEEATCLYAGIVTDTGRFQHSNTTPETLRTAAALREVGVDHELVSTSVYESLSFEYLHVLGIVLARAQMKDGIVWSYLDQMDLAGMGLDETEHFIDSLRSVRGCRMAALLKEQPEGGYKVSLRSRGEIDVSRLAQSFGGGGHARAAGFTAEGPVEAVVSAIRERAEEATTR